MKVSWVGFHQSHRWQHSQAVCRASWRGVTAKQGIGGVRLRRGGTKWKWPVCSRHWEALIARTHDAGAGFNYKWLLWRRLLSREGGNFSKREGGVHLWACVAMEQWVYAAKSKRVKQIISMCGRKRWVQLNQFRVSRGDRLTANVATHLAELLYLMSELLYLMSELLYPMAELLYPMAELSGLLVKHSLGCGFTHHFTQDACEWGTVWILLFPTHCKWGYDIGRVKWEKSREPL